jgi:hypothetical protein
MYYTESEKFTARKQHQCTYCAEMIEPGTRYVRWMSVDSDAFSNKMHEECYEDVSADGSPFEYVPFSYERPVVTA